jgi:hypothetical protein
MLISTALLLDSIIRDSVCTPAKLPCRRVEVGYEKIYTISGIKAILQDSSVKIADDEGVSPSSSVITRVSCNML